MTKRQPSAQVRVIKAFECVRIADEDGVARQIIVYPAGWVGRMPGHHIAAGEAQGAVERL